MDKREVLLSAKTALKLTIVLHFTAMVCSMNCAKYGREIGVFGVGSSHGVSGTVYAANNKTIVIQDFTFDGTASKCTMTLPPIFNYSFKVMIFSLQTGDGQRSINLLDLGMVGPALYRNRPRWLSTRILEIKVKIQKQKLF